MADDHSTINGKQHEYGNEYSEESFWKKIAGFALSAGRQVIEKALVLYYVAQSPETPPWAKAVIYSTLGYFIFPLDAIPDFTPIVGFADDLGAILSTLAIVVRYATPEILERAKERANEWFGGSKEEHAS